MATGTVLDVRKDIGNLPLLNNLPFLAKGIVEGFVSGIHKSPFHGFSSEFAEHKIYNQGDSTRHIDWKLYAKTDKYYTKQYEDETNLRCHIIVDASASMYYPQRRILTLKSINKIGFTSLSVAAVINLLKRQRDAVGLSIYSDDLHFYAPEKGNERHFLMLYTQLDELIKSEYRSKVTNTYTHLHHIAEKLHRRSLVLLFTDMFQSETGETQLFEALRHLKYNRHEVILFHTYSKAEECDLDFDNRPMAFVDTESGERVNLFIADVKDNYRQHLKSYFKRIKTKCSQYDINYVPSDISRGVENVLNTCLSERHKYL